MFGFVSFAELPFSTLPEVVQPIVVSESRGGIPPKKVKTKLKKNEHDEIAAIVKREFDILDGTYTPEAIENVKQLVLPQIKEFDYKKYDVALAEVNELLLKVRTQVAEYDAKVKAEIEAELDDEQAVLMLL